MKKQNMIFFSLYLFLIDDNDLSPSSDLNSTTKSSQFLTPNNLTQSTTMNLTLSSTPIRSRTNSISSNSSILTNAANLLTDTPNEYSYLDSTKVNAFINEINNNNPIKLDDISILPAKLIRKRRLSIEYPFPFLVEQAKKQRMTPKKLREELLKQQQQHLLRPPSPEYNYLPFDDNNLLESIQESPSDLILPQQTNLSIISKRQRAIDFRHLQTNMHKIILKNFEHNNNHQLVFSDIYSNIHQDDNRTISSSDIGICFAALLNNAVRYQFELQSNDIRDDIHIFSSQINNKH